MGGEGWYSIRDIDPFGNSFYRTPSLLEWDINRFGDNVYGISTLFGGGGAQDIFLFSPAWEADRLREPVRGTQGSRPESPSRKRRLPQPTSSDAGPDRRVPPPAEFGEDPRPGPSLAPASSRTMPSWAGHGAPRSVVRRRDPLPPDEEPESAQVDEGPRPACPFSGPSTSATLHPAVPGSRASPDTGESSPAPEPPRSQANHCEVIPLLTPIPRTVDRVGSTSAGTSGALPGFTPAAEPSPLLLVGTSTAVGEGRGGSRLAATSSLRYGETESPGSVEATLEGAGAVREPSPASAAAPQALSATAQARPEERFGTLRVGLLRRRGWDGGNQGAGARAEGADSDAEANVQDADDWEVEDLEGTDAETGPQEPLQIQRSATGNEVRIRLSVDQLWGAVQAVSDARRQRDSVNAQALREQGGPHVWSCPSSLSAC